MSALYGDRKFKLHFYIPDRIGFGRQEARTARWLVRCCSEGLTECDTSTEHSR